MAYRIYKENEKNGTPFKPAGFENHGTPFFFLSVDFNVFVHQ